MTRMLLLAACLVLMLAIVVMVKQRSVPPATAGSPITLEQIRNCAELVTLRVPLQQLVEARIDGYVGGVRCLALARGEVLIATDLEKAQLSYHAGGVTLTLEQPRVISCTLDLEQTSVIFVGRGGLWKTLPGEAGESAVIERTLRHAEREMAQVAASSSNIEAAKAHAIDAITDLLGERLRPLRIEWSSTEGR